MGGRGGNASGEQCLRAIGTAASAPHNFPATSSLYDNTGFLHSARRPSGADHADVTSDTPGRVTVQCGDGGEPLLEPGDESALKHGPRPNRTQQPGDNMGDFIGVNGALVNAASLQAGLAREAQARIDGMLARWFGTEDSAGASTVMER